MDFSIPNACIINIKFFFILVRIPKKKTLAALVVECDTDTHINAKRPTDVRSERNYIEFALENAALFKYIFAFRGNLCKFGKLIKCGHCDVRIFVCVDGNIHKDTVI